MSSALTADVTVVSVSYNSSDVLPTMLASVPDGVRVIIVDNGGNDTDTLKRLAVAHPFTLIESAKNLGFGRACNAGAAQAETPLVLFLNPDAELADGALDALLHAAETYGEATAFNPLLEVAPGRYYRKAKSRLVPQEAMRAAAEKPLQEDTELPVLSGAALLVRKTAFDAVGGFDPAIFLYFEDDDLTVRMREDGGRLMRVADAVVRHAGNQSTGSSIAAMKAKNYHWARSRVYVSRKHRQPSAFLGAFTEGLKAVTRKERFGEVQPVSARAQLLWGALSTIRDGGVFHE
ncbi:glycosyltransferase family 2 protein [Gymnodinialimonas hymeniacidonis]|uniref:glycosyltransferase family 2 protein n=1 Tax=Gymnodinialimonas hymeniacidonis TaxID=3126508 RepID=UPI0034C5E0F6